MNRRYIPVKQKKTIQRRKVKVPYAIFVLVFLVLAIPFGARLSGYFLVQDDSYKSVECALLVTAEGSLESGYTAILDDMKSITIDRAILSGSSILKLVSTADVALNELKYEDFDKDKLFYFYHDAKTLVDEAAYIIPFLRKKGVDTVVVYTAKHMSSRVKYIYNSLAQGDPHILVSYSASELYNPKAWIHNNESRKLWAEEWAKYILNVFELMFDRSLDSEIKVFNYESGYSVRTKDSEVIIDDSLLEDIPVAMSVPIQSSEAKMLSSSSGRMSSSIENSIQDSVQ